MADLRLIFAGTPEFAATPLQALLEAGHQPIAVYTQPDRPAGRGRKLQASPVKQLATDAGIEVYQPHSLRDEKAQQELSALEADLMIVVAYGLLLPAAVLEAPRLGCWNIHASLLPRWRGAAPIQRAIEAGDERSGVCIMQMDEGLDTGPVLLESELPLDGNETGGSLHDALAELGSRSLLQCLAQLRAGSLGEPVPQPDEGACYARKLDKSEARIDWADRAIVLERRIRAFDPWPVAWCEIQGERTRIWRSRVMGAQPAAAKAGDVLGATAEGIDVATGDGVLRLLELQPAGKRRMQVTDYLNARHLPERLDSNT